MSTKDRIEQLLRDIETAEREKQAKRAEVRPPANTIAAALVFAVWDRGDAPGQADRRCLPRCF